MNYLYPVPISSGISAIATIKELNDRKRKLNVVKLVLEAAGVSVLKMFKK